MRCDAFGLGPDTYLAEVKGKYIDELDVPKTELEEDWEAEKLF